MPPRTVLMTLLTHMSLETQRYRLRPHPYLTHLWGVINREKYKPKARSKRAK